MPPRKPASARNAQRQAEADANFAFYNEGRGVVLDTEGETVGPVTDAQGEPVAGDAPDHSKADAAAAETALSTVPIRFSVTDDHLDRLRKQAETVSFDTPEGYESGRKLIATLRALSGDIERTRKIIKAPVLAVEYRIDDAAKGLMNQVNDIRDPLQALKDNADAERARRRRAAEEAEREAIRVAEQAALAAEREAIEAERRALAEAQARAAEEAARVAEEQRVARQAVEAQQAEERRAFEAERRAFAEAQAQLEADRRVLEQGSRDLALAQEVTAALQVHAESAPASAEVANSWGGALAESRVSQPEIDAASVESAANMSHGMVDWVSPPAIAGEAAAIREFARQIRAIKAPVVTSAAAGAIVEQVEFLLKEAAEALESFDEQEAATAAE